MYIIQSKVVLCQFTEVHHRSGERSEDGMPHTFSREELYDLVWSEPMRVLASRYGISDVGLAKACRRYGIPVPERGYWAKLRAGKKVQRRPLLARGPGMSDEVIVGAASKWAYHQGLSDQDILDAVPVPPEFDRAIEDVAAEITAAVGRVTVPKSMHRPHRLIGKLLEADDERRQKAVSSTFVYGWDQPKFDSPYERRRLRLLNAIFTALERQGMKPRVRGSEARDLGVEVNDQSVTFSVDDAKVKPFTHSSYYEPCRNPSGRMKVVIASWRSAEDVRRAWEDAKDEPVEKWATDIVVKLIVTGERQHREAARRRYEWMIERKAQLIEEARLREEEEERQERERLARLEQDRIDRLLADAAALQQARDIRTYVQEVKNLRASADPPVGDDEFRAWEQWALLQADRLDPVASGRFLPEHGRPGHARGNVLIGARFPRLPGATATAR